MPSNTKLTVQQVQLNNKIKNSPANHSKAISNNKNVSFHVIITPNPPYIPI